MSAPHRHHRRSPHLDLNPINNPDTIMKRCITLLKFTEKGSTHIKESTSRAHAFDALAEKSGVKVEGQFWTIGHYDGALVLAADSEAKILHLLASLAALGNVRTETLQAFTDKEFDAILKA